MSPASPEMDRLANCLVGDWKTVEMMERGPSFPEGGSRKGHVHRRLASGGYTLIYEVHSDGSAGKLDGFLTIWWDKNTNLYYFLACFNNPNGPCRMRGTAHWDGDSFVNDHDSVAHGNKTRWRDTFTFTVTSHTLVAAMDSGSGSHETCDYHDRHSHLSPSTAVGWREGNGSTFGDDSPASTSSVPCRRRPATRSQLPSLE